MPKPSRWTGEKRYEIVQEVLRQKEPIAQIARRHGVSDALLHQWRQRFFEGGKAALDFEAGGTSRGEREALEAQIEELQKLIGEQAVEIRFLKKLSKG
jgi:putative transposase